MTWGGNRYMDRVRGAMERALTKSAVIVQQEVQLQLSKRGRQPSHGAAPAPVGQPPGVRTGHLRRSWQMGNQMGSRDKTAIRAAVNPRIRVGSNLAYARIHELGGVISAKKGGYLTIPLNRQAEVLLREHGSTRNIPGLFRVGNALARKTGKSGKLQFLFALKRSIKIPKRPYVRPAIRAAGPKVVQAFAAALKSIPGAGVVGGSVR